MPTTSPVPINPDVLTWARKESGYAVDRVADRLQVKAERVRAWERGDRPPTLRQVQELARFLHRPLNLFFFLHPRKCPRWLQIPASTGFDSRAGVARTAFGRAADEQSARDGPRPFGGTQHAGPCLFADSTSQGVARSSR